MLNSMPVLFSVLRDAEFELVLHVRRELVGAADDAEADVVLEQRASSSRRYRFSSIISMFTSVRGRFQFSTENA